MSSRPGARASEHFAFREFDCHDGTKVPPHAYDDLRALCRGFLEPLRDRFGPTLIVSGYRPREYNRRVGGAPQSFHIYERWRQGAAADVRCQRGTVGDWYVFLNRMGAPGLGRYSTHVHVDNRAGHARW